MFEFGGRGVARRKGIWLEKIWLACDVTVHGPEVEKAEAVSSVFGLVKVGGGMVKG